MSAADFDFEVERYELHALPRFRLQRRKFFKLLGGGVLVVCLVRPAAGQESGARPRGGRGGGGRPQEIGAWLHIAEDGAITVFTGKVEVGQNIRTSLTQVVAEELRAPVASIRMIMGDTELVPYDAGTFGSQTTPQMASQLRRVAAAAREVLLDLAAEQQKAERSSLRAADGKITNQGSGKSVTYGQVTKGQKLMKAVGDNTPITPASDWKVAGTSVAKVDGASFVTGKHQYTSDVQMPGLRHGCVVRPSAFGAKLGKVDSSAAEKIAGVEVVHEGEFLGVVAGDPWTAHRAARAIQAEWIGGEGISDTELFAHLKKTARGAPAAAKPTEPGNEKETRLQSAYTIAYIAHTPLEPRAAVAEWKDDKLTVWTGTQRPFGVRSELATLFKIPEEKVHVLMPDTGSGYGGKHTGEAALEAARLAKAVKKPVKLVWTRAEEFTWAYVRPAGVIEISSAVSAEGRLTAWEFHNYNSGGSALRTLYDVPGAKAEFHNSQSPLRQGSYRGLAATANHFARESHMDELASAVKMDPLEFRLKNLQDPRLRAVLEAAAAKFEWSRMKSTPTTGYGIAGGSEKNSYVATCAEVKIDPKSGAVSVVRVVQAFECGAVLNPDHLKNQNEGAVVMGIGGALFEAVHFAGGKVTNALMAEYRVPRFSDTPKIEIVLLDKKDVTPIGAGETPIVTIAPAIGNAIFAATGQRLRSMPMAPNGLKVA